MGQHENYHISRALQHLDEEENFYYQQELEEQYEEEHSERYEQLYELTLKKEDYLNTWLLIVRRPLFFDTEFTKYFNTLKEVEWTKMKSVYAFWVRLKEDMSKEASEDFLYQTFDTIQFAMETDTRDTLYNLPF